MAKWENNNPIDYSANGDDIDAFAQKSKATFEQIFTLLNKLRSNGAQAGTDISDAVPYSFLIDTATETIYMPKMVNGQLALVELGDIDTYFGLTAEKIGAVRNRENSMGSLMCGSDANKPQSGNETHDWYWAYDTSKIYSWTGSAWKVEFSLNFADLLDYERYCVARSEVATNGANKILRLDSQGKANVNITGSPERLLGLLIDVQNLRDDHVLVYDAAKGKIVNKPRNDISLDDVTYTGEAGKVAGIADDGKLHANLEGSASEIDELVVDTTGMQEGQVLVLQNGRLKPADKDDITDDDISVTVTAGKLVKGNAQNKVEGSVTGTAEGLHGILVNGANPADGHILRYHVLDNSLHFEPVGAVGDAASFVLTAEGEMKVNYNGTSPVNIDMSDLLGADYLDVLRYYSRFKVVERNLDNIIYYLVAQNMYPDFNALTYGIFGEQGSDIDEFQTRVTSAIAGDDSIDVESIDGIVPGANYYITDGDKIERITLKSYAKSGSVLRLIAEEPLTNTYNIGMTYLYRTTADITAGQASAGSVQRTRTWNADSSWQGVNADTPMTISMNTTIDHLSDFAVDGDITFNSSGMITLTA